MTKSGECITYQVMTLPGVLVLKTNWQMLCGHEIWQDFDLKDSTKCMMKQKFNGYGCIKSKLLTLNMRLK